MDEQRRAILNAGAALSATALMGCASAQTPEQAAGTVAAPPPGKPGEFDWLAGEWRIKNRRLLASKEWDLFDGEATCWTILAGVGSIEELRIPARNFSGMGIRLLDQTTNLWNDFWVNAKSGVLATPGQTGGFIDGAGVFGADDMDGDTPIKVRGVWDNISAATCRWRQSVSRDGSRTWEDNWIMDWTRA